MRVAKTQNPSRRKYLGLEVTFKKQTAATLELDRLYQGTPTNFCFLQNAKADRPWGLAIGTNTQDIFVFKLPENGQKACKLVRYFRDHVGNITSLKQSADERFLASSSSDATTKLWNLDGIEKDSLTWRMWGAEFSIIEGKVKIAELHPAGILTSRGFKTGDNIGSIKLKVKKNDAETTEFKKADDIVKYLSNVDRMLKSTVFSSTRDGKVVVQNIRAGWEPLVSLLVTKEKQWAIWSPKGYYASSEIGDNFFGWITNNGRNNQPKFSKASTLRADFENPAVIRKILELGSFGAAVEAIEIEPKSLQAVLKNQPQIEILRPIDGTIVKSDKSELKVRIDLTTGKPDEFEFRAFVNGIPLKSPKWEKTEKQIIATWPMELIDFTNRISVKIARKDKTEASVLAEGITVLRTEAPNFQKRKVHLFALSAEAYPEEELVYPHDDAAAIKSIVQKRIGNAFEVGAVSHFQMQAGDQDFAADLKSEFGKFKKLVEKQKISPNDLLIIFVAGHGWYDVGDILSTKEFYFIPPHDDVYQDMPLAEKRDVSIAWKVFVDFFEDPENFQCRRIYLLDTCHSGGTNHYYRSARSLFDNEALLLSACTSDGLSFESKKFKHGLFTHSIMRAIEEGLADGVGKKTTDGVVSLEETKEFVIQDVSKTAKRFNARQTPVAYGSKDLWFITLSKALNGKKANGQK